MSTAYTSAPYDVLFFDIKNGQPSSSTCGIIGYSMKTGVWISILIVSTHSAPLTRHFPLSKLRTFVTLSNFTRFNSDKDQKTSPSMKNTILFEKLMLTVYFLEYGDLKSAYRRFLNSRNTFSRAAAASTHCAHAIKTNCIL